MEMLETDPVEELIAELGRGGIVGLSEGRDPSDWCCMCLSAQRADVESLRTLTRGGPGATYLCLSDARCEQLALQPIAPQPGGLDWRGSVTMSISHRDTLHGSWDEIATVIVRAADHRVERDEFTTPGLVQTLRLAPGGCLERARQIEAAADLARLAGDEPAAVVSALLNPDGTMARIRDLPHHPSRRLHKFATVQEVVQYRLRHERLSDKGVTVQMPTAYGEFRLHAYTERLRGLHHVALVKGDVAAGSVVPVSVHLKCFAGDVLQSVTCNCSRHLEGSLRHIEREGVGVLIYLIRDQPLSTVCVRVDTPEVESESYELSLAAQILADLGVHNVSLLVSPGQAALALELERFGLRVERADSSGFADEDVYLRHDRD